MEYVKLWTTFHDDPSIQNLSAKAIVTYVNALSWSGRHEKHGVYELIGKPTAAVQELVAAGKLEPKGEGSYRIHGWSGRQTSPEEMEKLRAKRRRAGQLGGWQSGKARKQTRSNLLAPDEANDEAQLEVEVKEDLEPSPDPVVGRLCALLADLVAANGSKRPTVTKRWENECDRLLRLDGRDPDEVEALIRWTQADSFWRGNVMSMVKFRAKYDTLRLRRDVPSNGSGKVEDSAVWSRSL